MPLCPGSVADCRCGDGSGKRRHFRIHGFQLSDEADADGAYEDWLEVQNTGSTAVNLAGWFLTDDPLDHQRWQFPSLSLPPGAKVVVWASNKNRNNAGQQLHTNFKLSSSGEFLALVKPDGTTVSHSYAPAYPPQIADVSYGLGMVPGSVTLVPAGAGMKYRVPASNADEATWFTEVFDDMSWTAGNFGAGFATSSADVYYTSGLINQNADLLSMWGQRSSVWFRTKFTVANPGELRERLRCRRMRRA